MISCVFISLITVIGSLSFCHQREKAPSHFVCLFQSQPLQSTIYPEVSGRRGQPGQVLRSQHRPWPCKEAIKLCGPLTAIATPMGPSGGVSIQQTHGSRSIWLEGAVSKQSIQDRGTLRIVSACHASLNIVGNQVSICWLGNNA